jgi:hypothetical protein
MKLYVHHFFSEQIFYKLFHNTDDRIYDIVDDIGTVNFTYYGTKFEVIFNPSIHFNEDGIHMLDYYTAKNQCNQNPNFNDIRLPNDNEVVDIPIIKRFADLVGNDKNWVISIFNTEKLIEKHDVPDDWYVGNVEKELFRLKNHKIISDNMFINDQLRYMYPNHHYAFTNTIFQWNEIISIRWYYEFNDVFKKLNFDYDLMYSVRHHKKHRVEILKELSKINNPRILLQRTNSMGNKHFVKYNNGLDIDNVRLNSIYGDNDFSNLTWIDYLKGINWDLFFRFLSKSKMQVLDESWAWSKDDFHSQYLSEKTFGLILAGIPFVSTHSYPLIMLDKILGVGKHPFTEDFNTHKGDSKLFPKFVKKFMENYENNYNMCKEWSDKCRELMMIKIENENSLLDLMIDNFTTENKKIQKNIKLL